MKLSEVQSVASIRQVSTYGSAALGVDGGCMQINYLPI